MDDHENMSQKPKRKNVAKLRQLEKEILEQTLTIKKAKDRHKELVEEYNNLKSISVS